MAQNFMARRSHFRILSLPLAVPITALVHIDLAGNGARDPGGNLLATHAWSTGPDRGFNVSSDRPHAHRHRSSDHRLSKQTPGSRSEKGATTNSDAIYRIFDALAGFLSLRTIVEQDFATIGSTCWCRRKCVVGTRLSISNDLETIKPIRSSLRPENPD